jgi:hypothetical protein
VTAFFQFLIDLVSGNSEVPRYGGDVPLMPFIGCQNDMTFVIGQIFRLVAGDFRVLGRKKAPNVFCKNLSVGAGDKQPCQKPFQFPDISGPAVGLQKFNGTGFSKISSLPKPSGLLLQSGMKVAAVRHLPSLDSESQSARFARKKPLR